jgi:hypothetical protein
MAAMAGASGARSWLQAQHASWLTPRRVRAATVGLFVAAALGSTVTLSGSAASSDPAAQAPSRQPAQQPAHQTPAPPQRS